MSKSNFEENMEELEKIVTELEKGDLNLEESISKFEEGIKLSKDCNKMQHSLYVVIYNRLKQGLSRKGNIPLQVYSFFPGHFSLL